MKTVSLKMKDLTFSRSRLERGSWVSSVFFSRWIRGWYLCIELRITCNTDILVKERRRETDGQQLMERYHHVTHHHRFFRGVGGSVVYDNMSSLRPYHTLCQPTVINWNIAESGIKPISLTHVFQVHGFIYNAAYQHYGYGEYSTVTQPTLRAIDIIYLWVQTSVISWTDWNMFLKVDINI